MTTNQTIDGIDRETLAIALGFTCHGHKNRTDQAADMQQARDKLRALLEAPACKTPGSMDCPGDGVGPCKKCPVAQPQGEPVAWIKPEVLATLRKDECCYAFGEQSPKGSLVPLYAEPPAPVAVVLPEREAMRDIIAQAIGGDAYDCTRVWSAWGVGTMSDDDFIPIADQEERLYEIADACLDELKRLNPSL